MKLYDSVIQSVEELLSPCKKKVLPLGKAMEEGGTDQMIFRSDIAIELGGGTNAGVSGIAYTDLPDGKDEIILIGEDLPSIKKDGSYARFVIVSTDDLGTGNELYQSLRRIDYVRYHLNPQGIMVRVSPLSKKETLVVDRKAKKTSFSEFGSYVIGKYKEIKGVRSVKVIFVTDPSFDYGKLSACVEKSDAITSALDHLTNKVKMDCNTCKLQPVCNEVEALCKEDFPSESLS